MADKKEMDDAQMFIDAVEDAASAPPEEAPEEAPEDLMQKAEELFMVIFGVEFDPESEDHAMLMEQIAEKMADEDYADLNPNQFALKMFREME